MESGNQSEFDLTSRAPIKKFAFIFICQKGKLEFSSCLLAASLKRFARVNFEMIAAIPGPKSFFGEPDKAAFDFLKKIGCRFFYFENKLIREGKRAVHHRIANKIFALNVPTDAEKIIFLDSDQLCAEKFFGDSGFFIPFSATLANHASSLAFADNLPGIYSSVGLEIPKARLKMPSAGDFGADRKEIYLPPHFCSALVAVDARFAQKFSEVWLGLFRQVSELKFFKIPYYSDEVALSLAAQKMEIPFTILDFKWKYRNILNYSVIDRIKNNNNVLKMAQSFLLEYPEIKKMAEENEVWRPILIDSLKKHIISDKSEAESNMAENLSGEKDKEIEISKPWMSDDEINLIKSYLEYDKIVFEWGAGGSTIEFSKRVKEYYSVEHDFNWYRNVLKGAGKNVNLFYIPPNTADLNWYPVFEEGRYGDFRNYIKFVNNIGSLGKKFDIVLIDGRARAECAIAVLPYISENSVIFIHDFDRACYWKALDYYEIIDVIDRLAALRIKKESFNSDRNVLMKMFLLKELV